MQQKNRTEIFEVLPVPAAVRAMAIPTIIGQLIVLFYNMADTFFVGLTNDPFMIAGTTLILPVFNLTISLACLAGVGGSALVSRLLGQKREGEASLVFSFCTYLALGISAAFSLSVLVFRAPLLRLLGANENIYRYAESYAVCVIVLGGIPTVLSNVFSNFLRSVGESKKAGFGITMGGIINILLDPLFMFVLLPDGMEIIGAGIATCLSNLISCAYFILVLYRLGSGSVLRLHSPRTLPEKESIRSVFAVGLPSCISTFLFDADYMVIDRLMSAYGDAALAAIGIVLKVERLPLNIGIGICQGMVPLVAYNYAAKNRDRLKKIIRYCLLSGIVCALVSLALYESFTPQIMRVFVREPQTLDYGTTFLRVRSLATPLMFLCFFHVHLFNGFGEGRRALMLGVVRWAALNIPMLFLFDHLFGMYGIVCAQAAADVIMAALSFLAYHRYERAQNVRLSGEKEA